MRCAGAFRSTLPRATSTAPRSIAACSRRFIVELLGGRQPGLDFAVASIAAEIGLAAIEARPMRPPRPHAATAEELMAHAALLATIAGPMWMAEL